MSIKLCACDYNMFILYLFLKSQHNCVYIDSLFLGNRFKALKVIHIIDQDHSDILNPHEKTHSYVVLNINGCSQYGEITEENHSQEEAIQGLVLLFLEPSRSLLNILLLPKNVVISEVGTA